MSTCDEPCDGCPNRAEHHLCDACCHDEVDAIRREERELREKLEWQAACTKALMESQERLAGELKEARVEVERLRGAKPELPPRPPDGKGLPRYGLRWNGPVEPIAVPLDDGYWTPWHLADAAYQRGAEAMREAAASCVGSDTALLQTYRSVLEGRIRALPVPEDDR